MSYLLDTDICSAFLKNDQRVVARAMLHFGGLSVSVITVGELLTWAMRASAPPSRVQGVRDFLSAAAVYDVDVRVAEKFGELRAALFDQGRSVGERDLLNAAIAIVHDLTIVTRDYSAIPGLTLDDWLIP